MEDSKLVELGWRIETFRRMGARGGRYYVFVSPDGKRLRSRVAVGRYLSEERSERSEKEDAKADAARPRSRLAVLVEGALREDALSSADAASLCALRGCCRWLRTQLECARLWKNLCHRRFPRACLPSEAGDWRRAYSVVDARYPLRFVDAFEGARLDRFGFEALTHRWDTRGLVFGEPVTSRRRAIEVEFTRGPLDDADFFPLVGFATTRCRDAHQLPEASDYHLDLEAVALSNLGVLHSGTLSGRYFCRSFSAGDRVQVALVDDSIYFAINNLPVGIPLKLRRVLAPDARSVGIVPIIGAPPGTRIRLLPICIDISLLFGNNAFYD